MKQNPSGLSSREAPGFRMPQFKHAIKWDPHFGFSLVLTVSIFASVLYCSSLSRSPLSSLEAQEANNAPPPPVSGVHVRTPQNIKTKLGETFELSVDTETITPIKILGIRLKTKTGKIKLKSWSLGQGLKNHIAENGEPPTCDVIIYPDGSQITMLMGLEIPYESEKYGQEWLKVEYEVTATTPTHTCITTETTEDYEEEDDPAATLFWKPGNHPCILVSIETQPWIDSFFVRGDANSDSAVTISDSIRILEHIFLGQFNPSCFDACDANDDGHLFINDAVILLTHLFVDAQPEFITGKCTYDPTNDSLPSCTLTDCTLAR